MDKKELRQIIQEQFQTIFQESKEEKLELDTQKLIDNLSDKEEELVSDILGEDVLEEGAFEKVREKFNSALKKGTMTLGILAAVLSSPDIAQAQKVQLKKDVTDSTWFLDKAEDFGNQEFDWRDGHKFKNPNFQKDLKDKRDSDREEYLKDTEGKDRYTASADKEYKDKVGSEVYRMEKWVNNLGQDSTVYKQYKDWGREVHKGLAGEYTKDVGIDLKDEPVKTIVNKDDVKAWKGDGWSEVTKKGNVANYYWTEDGKTSITPSQWKGLQKAEKLSKDKLGKKVYKDRDIASGKRLMDKGFKSSDFYKVDLDQIDSPQGGDYPSDYPDALK